MKEYLNTLLKGEAISPHFQSLGLVLESLSVTEAVMRLPVQAAFMQGAGNISGGIIATLADEAMAHAVMAGMQEGRRVATLEMNVRFLEPAKKGSLLAKAKILRRGGTAVTAEAKIYDDDGTLIAVAGASFWQSHL